MKFVLANLQVTDEIFYFPAILIRVQTFSWVVYLEDQNMSTVIRRAPPPFFLTENNFVRICRGQKYYKFLPLKMAESACLAPGPPAMWAFGRREQIHETQSSSHTGELP